MARALLWLRNDLRLHDNAVFAEAVKRVKAGGVREVLPVFVLDVRLFRDTGLGFLKTGALRAKFLLESVLDLKASLRAINSDLLVAIGRAEEVLPRLLHPAAPNVILFQREVTSEELAVDSKVRAACGARATLEPLWGATLIHVDDLPFAVHSLPDTFTPFRTRVEAASQPRPLLPQPTHGQLPLPAKSTLCTVGDYTLDFVPSWKDIPVLGSQPPPSPDARSVLQFRGGESEALSRLDYYVNADKKLVAHYFDTRNGLLGGDYSTKFAPWLALGCLSPRLIYQRLKSFEQSTGIANKSTYWVVFELLWRDFFRFFALKHGKKIFLPGGTIDSPKRWPRDMTLFRQWVAGQTGAPFVDACMRELASSGFMSNRGRQNVASFLIHNLGLDWRLGAAYFESVLLDYDVCSNWGNWVVAAGLTGGRLNVFNIVKQSLEYDPDGAFVRTWVKELANVPGAAVHTPHRLSVADQQRYGLQVGVTYPRCTVLDGMASAAHAAGAGPHTAQARWSQSRYQPPKKPFRPKSDFERFG